MVFDMALLVSEQVLQLALHGLERIAQCHMEVGVGRVLVGRSVCDQLVPWHRQVNADMEVIALGVVAVKLLDRDAATVEVRVKVPELVNVVANPGLCGF
jgi:hypothetical protein